MVNDDDQPAATATASTHDDTSSDSEEKKFYDYFETLKKSMHPEIMGFTYDLRWHCKVKELTEFKVYADTPLLYSIWSHDRFPSMFQKLIDQGVNVDETDRSGFSPLHLAIIFKKYDLAKILIERGANVRAKSPNFGRQPLHYLAKDLLCTVHTKYLIEIGNIIPTNTTEKLDEKQKRIPIMRQLGFLLIRHGASITDKDDLGEPAGELAEDEKPFFGNWLRKFFAHPGEQNDM